MATSKKTTRKKRKTDIRLSLTRDLIDQACALARKGNFRQTIRAKLGVPKGTWDAWVQRGKQEIRDKESGILKGDLSLKACFVLEMDEAESSVQTRIHEDILDSDDLELKFKFLKCRYPKQYAHSPKSYVDDESGEEVENSATDILLQRLAAFVKD